MVQTRRERGRDTVKLISILVILIPLIGCLGRNDDKATNANIDIEKMGLDPAQPAVLVFGAVWCKPCRAEILEFNKLQEEFSSQLQVRGLLVEGEEKGQASTLEMVDKFVGPQSQIPGYKIVVDREWTLFDQLNLREGRQLPTIVFVGSQGIVKRVVQRSLDYDKELKPLVESLIKNSLAPDTGANETPVPSALILSAEDWSRRPGNDSNSLKYQNLVLAWTEGRKKYNFLESNMPFLTGAISFLIDSQGSDVPVKGFWSYKSHNGTCNLTVHVFEDGRYQSASGVCF